MMRKIVFILAAVLLSLEGAAYAIQHGTPEYEKMKEIKKAQREKKQTAVKNPASTEKSFWQKEAERSGFAGTAAMFGNAIHGVIPLDPPNSRKSETK